MATKIAEFFAELDVKVKNLKGLNNFERTLSDLPKKFKKAKLSQNDLGKSIRDGTKELSRMTAETKRLAKAEQDRLKKKYQARERTHDMQAWKSRGRSSNIRRNLDQNADLQAWRDRGAAMAADEKSKLRALKREMEASRLNLQFDQRAARAKEAAAKLSERLAQKELAAQLRAANAKERAARRAAAEAQTSPRTGGRGILGRAGMGGALGAASSNIAGFLPGFGGAYALIGINRTNQELQGQKLAMTSVTGSEQAGAEQINWVRKLADEVGFNFKQSTPAYTRMLASGKSTGLSTESVQNIFSGVAKYGRVQGLSSEDMKGSMRAIEQMMNKSQVMSEELNIRLAA